MRIQKWIKATAVAVLAVSMTGSAFWLIHAAGQEVPLSAGAGNWDGASVVIKSEPSSPAGISLAVSMENAFSQEQETPPLCGVSEDAEELFVSFSVLESSAEGCRLQVVNNSASHMLSTGYAFSLEVKKGGQYVPADYHTPPCWPEIACMVEPGGTLVLRFDWHASYGSLAPGEYRIVTEYFSETSAFTQKTTFTVIE